MLYEVITVLPEYEHPEADGYQNHNENVESPGSRHLVILRWLSFV